MKNYYWSYYKMSQFFSGHDIRDDVLCSHVHVQIRAESESDHARILSPELSDKSTRSEIALDQKIRAFFHHDVLCRLNSRISLYRFHLA